MNPPVRPTPVQVLEYLQEKARNYASKSARVIWDQAAAYLEYAMEGWPSYEPNAAGATDPRWPAIRTFARRQADPDRHPYTCPNNGDESHPVRFSGHSGVLLIALQPDGTVLLICRDCDYTQALDSFDPWPTATGIPA